MEPAFAVSRLPKPYYEDDSVTIYHGDCRDFLQDLVFDAVLADPPYGVEGGKGGDSRKFAKAAYCSDHWCDTESYVDDVCVPTIDYLVGRGIPMAVTPGVRHLRLYPSPEDIGCFWTPAAATHGPWGFTTFQPILYYGRDHRAGRGSLPSGIAVT